MMAQPIYKVLLLVSRHRPGSEAGRLAGSVAQRREPWPDEIELPLRRLQETGSGREVVRPAGLFEVQAQPGHPPGSQVAAAAFEGVRDTLHGLRVPPRRCERDGARLRDLDYLQGVRHAQHTGLLVDQVLPEKHLGAAPSERGKRTQGFLAL